MKRNSFTARTVWPVFAIAFAGSLLALFHYCVPWNMDEFVSYQTLAMFLQPLSAEHSLTFPDFYLRLLNQYDLPLLTYDYIGSLSCWLYAPFHFVYPSPTMARAAGLVALGFQAFIIARTYRLRWSIVYVGLMCLVPYAFVHIVDTGPVAFQVTSVLLIGYLLNRWIRCRRSKTRLAMMAGTGLVVACACWAKPSYFFASAGVAVLCLSAFITAVRRRYHADVFRRAGEGIVFLVFSGVPTFLIYHATQPKGGLYLPVVGTRFLPSQVESGGFWTRFQENVFHFVVNPLDALSPCFSRLPHTPAWAITSSAFVVVVILLVLCRRLPVRHRIEVGINLSMFVGALLLVATNIYAESMHHAVLAFPFLIMAVARGCQLARGRRGLLAALAGLLVCQATIYFAIPSMYRELREIGEVRSFVSDVHEAIKSHRKTAVIVCVDWGIYFVETMYGARDQVAIALIPYDSDPDIDRAVATAEKTGRDLLFVGLHGNRRIVDRLSAAGIPYTAVPGDHNPWRFWRVNRDDFPRLLNRSR